MKKFFKTSLSVICIITMLASLIIPSMVMPASAYSFVESQDVIRYTFKGDFSVDAVENMDTAGGAFAISNGALEVKADHERCVAFNNGTEWLILEDGAYMVEIKYTYNESQFETTVGANTSAKRGTIRSVSKDTFKPTDFTVGDDCTDPILTFEEEKIGQELTACAYFEFKGTTGNNVAFCAGGKTHCYIKEIAISKKSFIDVIASDGYNTAPITTLSGVFGDKAELPGANSFEKENSCEGFKGFFADPEFKKSIITEEFTFPTDVLKTTVYAKMDFVNPVAVNIDFETQIADETNKTSYATIDTISKDGNENNKAFKSKIAENFDNGQWGRGKMIYNSDHSSIVINAGWYTVSWDYIIEGEKTLQDHATKNKAYFINYYDKTDGHYSAAHTPISGADFDLLPDKKTLNTWQTETRKIFLSEDVEDFGIFFAPLEAVVYIDNIQFTPIVAEPDLFIDFSEQSECDNGSSIYKVAEHTSDGHENSLGIIFSNAYTGTGQYCEIKQGGSSCGGGVSCNHANDNSTSIPFKAGNYLIKYSYYFVDAPGYNEKKVVPEKFTFKFAYNADLDKSIIPTIGAEIIDQSMAKGTWHTASMLISPKSNIETFGFYLEDCPYHIYIDDISVYSVNLSSSMVIDFEGLEKDTNTTDTTGIANIGTHIGVDSNPNNTVFAFLNSSKYARGNTIKDLEQNFYSIKAGTYKISWNYKIVTTSSYTAGKDITGSLFLIDGYDKNVADNETNRTNAKRIDCASFDLLPDRTKIGEWQEASVAVTLKTDIEKLGLFVDRLTAGVNAYVDNITFTPTSDVAVKTAFYLLFRTPIDAELEDAQGNKMEANSAVYTDPNGDLRSAFRFLSSFNYHKSGKDLYLDYDRQIKIVKRGMKVGIATKDEETGIYTYNQKTKSEKAANATAWSNIDANLEYTFMMFNISEKNRETTYFATPYLVLEIKGKQFVILGETKKTSVEDVFATSQAKADGATWYYQYQE